MNLAGTRVTVAFLLAALASAQQTLIGKTVAFDNLAGSRAIAWTTAGMPEAVASTQWLWTTLPNGKRFATIAHGHELHIRADLAPRAKTTGTISAMTAGDIAATGGFRFAPWVQDDLPLLLPRFQLHVEGSGRLLSNPLVLVTGGGAKPADFAEIEAFDPAQLVIHFRTRIESVPLTMEGWLYIGSGSEIVEFEIRSVYGTAVPGQPREKALGSLTMTSLERPHLDYQVAKGLRDPVPLYTDSGVTWDAEIASAGLWHRARTIEATGAFLCLPTRVADAVGDPRAVNLEHRREAPVTSMLLDWDGKWLAFGKIPDRPLEADVEQQRRFAVMIDRLHTAGSEYDTRRYAQPPPAGTTGEQAEFGLSRCEHAIAMAAPWAIWDLRYHVQAEALRPTANIEPNGEPVRFADHPRVRMSNRFPDQRLSSADMLGWPPPPTFVWITGYSGEDQQHRSDHLIAGEFAMTRSRSLGRTLANNLVCDQFEHARTAGFEPALGSGAGSGRGLGRTLISMCAAKSVGFAEYDALIRDTVRRAHRSALWQLLPADADHSVRILWLNPEGAKYGWLHPDGTRIIGWVVWEEAIACTGFFAAWRATGMPEARELALTAARTITKHGWFQVGGQWQACYAVRWRTDDPGRPLPASAYVVGPSTDVWAGSVSTWWILGALQVLDELDPTSQDAARAREILAAAGPYRIWRDACWGALR